MKFKNKKTGVIWEIIDDAHIKRLQADDDYSIVNNTKTKAEPKKPTKSPVNDTKNEKDTKKAKTTPKKAKK